MTPDDLVAAAQNLLANGKSAEAAAACRRALALDPDCLAAHRCWAQANLPGEDFLAWLRRFHDWVSPRVYVEIGVDAGRTLSLAQPPTQAFGIDPVAAASDGLPESVRLFPMTSDAFFETEAARALTLPIDLAFIDGLHLFEQALRDFIHVERRAARESVILFHDCLPLDAATSSRQRRTGFWSGDVWKLIPILRTHRPDLEVFVIATFPTGLGVVTRLDPGSTVLASRFDELVERSLARELPEENALGERLAVVSNDADSVRRRLQGARYRR